MGFYRALLRLYPASFRIEYGDEMEAVFARKRNAAEGAAGRATVWAATIFETLGNAAGAHLDILRQDLRYAARTLARAPGFALTTIAVTAIGIGANTAAFSVTDFVLLRPLPFPQPDRIVKIYETVPGYSQTELSPGNFRDLQARSHSFQAFGMYTTWSANWSGAGDPRRLSAAEISSDALRALGVAPHLGRSISPEDDRPGAPRVLVLSYRLWTERFAADPAALGEKMILDGAPYSIVGVMPREFRFPSPDVDIWKPLALPETAYQDRADNYVTGIARLKPGVTIEHANAELNAVAAELEREFPKENERTRANVIRIGDQVSRQSRLLLAALFGAAFCVLLIACANLANLLLARGLERRRELAVRTAIGAGRERLIRQTVTETLLLAMAGGAIGIALAYVCLPLMASLAPDNLPTAEAPTVDGRVLLFAAALTLFTGLAFGAWPAWRMGRGVDLGGLREGARSGGGARERTRSALVAIEVAVTITLLVSAGLLLRALERVESVDTGFRAGNVLTLETFLPPKYNAITPRLHFYDRVLTGVRRLPGVVSAAYVTYLPLGKMRGGIWPVEIGGETLTRNGRNTASLRYISPGFFATLGIPLQQGRDVSEADTLTSPMVAVVSRSFARRYWPNADPIGRQFRFALDDRMVVGVVGDVRVRGLERESEPQVYLPYKQQPDDGLIGYVPKALAIRTAVEPESLAGAVRFVIRQADPDQPVTNVRTMQTIVEDETAARSTQARLLAGFAAIAFLLAAVGIHGLLSFAVAQRRQEIGVRMALGAQPEEILAMVIRQAAILAGAGAIPGAVLAYWAATAMQALLAGVRPADAITFAAAIGLCAAMTILGSWLPAWRAVRVDPITALRSE